MKRITLITGHYGSGKTNFAVNLALRQAAEGKKVTVVDLDIVNPYFRTADFAELFEQNGIHLEKTLYANTSLDIPAISFDLARLAYEEECLIGTQHFGVSTQCSCTGIIAAQAVADAVSFLAAAVLFRAQLWKELV